MSSQIIDYSFLYRYSFIPFTANRYIVPKIYDYAKRQRSHMGDDSDEFGNTINLLYKGYSEGYIDYLNSHPEEHAKRNDRLRKLGYN